VVLSQGLGPKGGGRSCAWFVLGNSRDRFQIGGFQLWAELPALAPGARCRLGRSVRSWAPQAMQWTATGLFQHNSDTPGTSEIRRECWSRGRIVSALLMSAAGGCHPSMEPPNPVATTMGWPVQASKRASQFDTARDLRQRVFMKRASRRAQHQQQQAVALRVQQPGFCPEGFLPRRILQ